MDENNIEIEKMEPLIPGSQEPQALPEQDAEMEALTQEVAAAILAANTLIRAYTTPPAEAAPPAQNDAFIPEDTDRHTEDQPIPEAEPAKIPETESTDMIEEEPAGHTASKPKRVRRKRIFRGALRFYSILLGLVLCILILFCCLMMPLRTMLEQYETAQPKYTAEEIYQLLFADPDWALLYDMAGIQATEFEGRDEYVAYMEEKVGARQLTYVEIAAGLSGQRRYSIRLGSEEVAIFTIVSADDGVSTFDRWSIGDVEVFFTRNESVTVNIMPGQTVYINGIPLDESYTTLKVSTAVEEQLPEGLHGYQYEQQQITGLLVQPDVVVLDEYNNPVPLTQDPVTGIFTVPIANTPSMTWGEKDLALSTIQTEALFAIRAISMAQLRQYFDPNSQAYADISSAAALTESYESYAFDDSATVIDSFYRYSDDLFSVRAAVKLDVTDQDGKVTSYDFCSTYFFYPNSAGNYMANQRLDTDLQEILTAVRITYAYGSTALQTELVSSTGTVFAPPLVTDADGSPVAYWYTLDESGTAIRILELQADGTYTLIDGQQLDMMTLYPEFGAMAE